MSEERVYYSNPVGDREAPDPFVTYDGVTGYYYLLYTRGKEVRIYRSRHIATIMNDESLKVFGVPEHGVYGCIWAPEMHKIDGRWYIYTCGATEPSGRERRRLFVLRSKSEDPFDGFEFAGFPDPGLAAIDPTVFVADDGTIYMSYAAENRGNRIHIRRMSSPTEFDGGSVMICEAEHEWEKVPPYVGDSTIVEGPFFVRSPDRSRLFILYSANGCWSDQYRLGVLEYTGGEMVSKEGWKKYPDFIFGSGNGTFGPGHMSFFLSPDKSQTWMAYHSMHESNVNVRWAPRYLHFQELKFTDDGFPANSEPLPMNVLYDEPKS